MRIEKIIHWFHRNIPNRDRGPLKVRHLVFSSPMNMKSTVDHLLSSWYISISSIRCYATCQSIFHNNFFFTLFFTKKIELELISLLHFKPPKRCLEWKLLPNLVAIDVIHSHLKLLIWAVYQIHKFCFTSKFFLDKPRCCVAKTHCTLRRQNGKLNKYSVGIVSAAQGAFEF